MGDQIPADMGDHKITVLSIDTAGVDGIIAATILEELEKQLQYLDGKGARIADYFDVIAGVSTGGLITAMLAAPNDNQRPLFPSKMITEFYFNKFPLILPPPPTARGIWGWIRRGSKRVYNYVMGPQYSEDPLHKIIRGIWGWIRRGSKRVYNYVMGPQYSGDPLHKIIREIMGNKRLRETLTNVVIPAHDDLKDKVIFSNFEGNNALSDVALSDVCIEGHWRRRYGFHELNNSESSWKTKPCLNLVLSEIILQSTQAISHLFEAALCCERSQQQPQRGDIKYWPLTQALEAAKSKDEDILVKKCLVLSLGTIRSFGMCYAHSAHPSYHRISRCLERHRFDSPDDYLRMEPDLAYKNSPLYLATDENSPDEYIDALRDIGLKLLDKRVFRVNMDTGEYEPVPDRGTNKDELRRFAQRLSDEKRSRAQQ